MSICRIALAVLVLAGCAQEPVVQPVAFNHHKHTVDNKLGCEFCHRTFATDEVSGRPEIVICGYCHAVQMGDSAEAEKVHGYVQRGEEIPWQRLVRMPDHVRYSHARHVSAGDLECEECHGAIGGSTAPPEEPYVDLDMDFCLDCHRERGVTTDCIACHR